MALDTGTRLGPYEILALLGVGGMGEVYKARDTRLDRTVAIKVLPPALAGDAQFRERFEREAKSISALNHPNICTLYDVGRQGEAEFLVMEYLDGETLAARLTRGALPVADAMRIAVEVAGALDKAHRQGIVHRDLKPGNVMLTKTGAKLLDFGLAKIGPAGVLAGTHGATVMPTATAPLTAQGTILGTFQYMAPEQVEGQDADARTDIFSFGATLYEMLTGQKAFSGKSQASLLGAILKDEPPPVSQVQPLAPPALDYLVRTCLAKDPDARFQTAHDLALQLKWIAEGGSAAGVPAPVIAGRRWRERLGWIAAAVVGAAFVGTAAIAVTHLREAAPVAEPLQFTIASPDNSLFFGAAPQFAISPDGRQLSFVASQQAGSVLWVRPLGALTPRPLPGTEQAQYPFWSADSRFIGFFAAGKLKKVQVSGGPPVPLCDAPNARGGTWNRDNVIVFASSTSGPLQRVSSAGGTPAALTELRSGEVSHRWPTFLPDGRRFLFLNLTPGSTGEIRLASLDASPSDQPVGAVTASDSAMAYALGHIVFAHGGTLMALPFDPDSPPTTVDPFPISEQIGIDSGAYAAFSASTTGVLTYARGSSRPMARLTWFDRAGKVLGVAGDSAEYFNVSLGPDERRVAVSLQTGSPPNRDIWLIDLARGGAPSRFTFDAAGDALPVWSSDGAQVVFISSRGGLWNLYVKATSGGQEELLQKSATTNYATSWSRDRQFLAYSDLAGSTTFDLWVRPMSPDKKPELFLQTPFSEDSPAFSPDGRWIAYESNESNRTEVYVRPYPVAGGQHMISRNGGIQPMWRDDGRELFFLAPDGTMMSADIAATTTFDAGVPRALFPTGVALTGNRKQYAVTKDGKRFLVIVPEQRTSPSPITVVVNWLAALPR